MSEENEMDDEIEDSEINIGREQLWECCVEAIELVLVPQRPSIPRRDIAYADWAQRRLHLRRADRRLELFDFDTGETVRVWLSSPAPDGHPVRRVFVDALLRWADNHGRDILGLAPLLTSEIACAASVVMTQFDYALDITSLHAEAVLAAFQEYLKDQIRDFEIGELNA